MKELSASEDYRRLHNQKYYEKNKELMRLKRRERYLIEHPPFDPVIAKEKMLKKLSLIENNIRSVL